MYIIESYTVCYTGFIILELILLKTIIIIQVASMILYINAGCSRKTGDFQSLVII